MGRASLGVLCRQRTAVGRCRRRGRSRGGHGRRQVRDRVEWRGQLMLAERSRGGRDRSESRGDGPNRRTGRGRVRSLLCVHVKRRSSFGEPSPRRGRQGRMVAPHRWPMLSSCWSHVSLSVARVHVRGRVGWSSLSAVGAHGRSWPSSVDRLLESQQPRHVSLPVRPPDHVRLERLLRLAQLLLQVQRVEIDRHPSARRRRRARSARLVEQPTQADLGGQRSLRVARNMKRALLVRERARDAPGRCYTGRRVGPLR